MYELILFNDLAKHNSNCKESEKVGEGPGSCSNRLTGDEESYVTGIVSAIVKNYPITKNMTEQEIDNAVNNRNKRKEYYIKNRFNRPSDIKIRDEFITRIDKANNTLINAPKRVINNPSTKNDRSDKNITDISNDEYIKNNNIISNGKMSRVKMGSNGQYEKLILFSRNRTKIFAKDTNQAVDLFKKLDKLPSKLSVEAKDIYITPMSNPHDKIMSEKFGREFISNASHKPSGIGSKRDTIIRWRCNTGSFSMDTLSHELAHSLDAKEGAVVGYYSDSKEYRNAFELDNSKFTSTYARESSRISSGNNLIFKSSLAEDFAESMKHYVVNNDSFRSMFPNKARYLDKILK